MKYNLLIMRITLLLMSIVLLTSSCTPSFDIDSINMDTLDNKEFSSIIEKTDRKKLIASEKADVGEIGAWKCNIKLVLYPDGTCDYTIGGELTDFSVNNTTSGSTSKGTWNIDKNASMYGPFSHCIGNQENTRLVITLENGGKSTAVLFKEDSALKLIDCDNGGRKGSLCEQIDNFKLVVPYGNLATSFDF